MTTKLSISFAGPFVSVQDAGRPGFMKFGIPASGPMDRTAFGFLKGALLGRVDFAAVEVSVGGLVLKCESGSITAGFMGGDFALSLDSKPLPAWSVFTLQPGSTLTIRPGKAGSWGYLGFCGNIDQAPWLNSRSAHLASGLGGKALIGGDEISISDNKVVTALNCALPIPRFALFDGNIRAVLGPQDDFFSPDACKALATTTFRVSPEYDRMGMRLIGAKIAPTAELTMPSEALMRGSVQVPGHGDPLVLLADHQTTGGYPKIATVISSDQDKLSQARSGDSLSFNIVSQHDAAGTARQRNTDVLACLESIEGFRGSIEERLGRSNLISGMVGPDPD